MSIRVRATKEWFDGMRRQRVGDITTISDEKITEKDLVYKKGDYMPTGKKLGDPKSPPAGKKLGDYKHFSPNYMELVDVPKKPMHKEGQQKSDVPELEAPAEEGKPTGDASVI